MVEIIFLATLEVNTLKCGGVEREFIEFIEVLGVDQNSENFVKAYWMYLNYITLNSPLLV